jgi:hypothetical protein
VEELSSAAGYAFFPVALVLGSIRPDLDSVSVSDSLIFDLSLIDSSVFENDLLFEFETWLVDQKL